MNVSEERPMDGSPAVEGVGRSGTEGQGPFYAVTLKVRGGRVEGMTFRTLACPWANRIGEGLARLAKDRTIAEAVRITEVDVDAEMGPVPRPKRVLVPMAVAALRDAAAGCAANT
jgi:NifU-like protein involved in Fe-S cluster formation